MYIQKRLNFPFLNKYDTITVLLFMLMTGHESSIKLNTSKILIRSDLEISEFTIIFVNQRFNFFFF